MEPGKQRLLSGSGSILTVHRLLFYGIVHAKLDRALPSDSHSLLPLRASVSTRVLAGHGLTRRENVVGPSPSSFRSRTCSLWHILASPLPLHFLSLRLFLDLCKQLFTCAEGQAVFMIAVTAKPASTCLHSCHYMVASCLRRFAFSVILVAVHVAASIPGFDSSGIKIDPAPPALYFTLLSRVSANANLFPST